MTLELAMSSLLLATRCSTASTMDGGWVVSPLIDCFFLTRVSHVGLTWRYKREKRTRDLSSGSFCYIRSLSPTAPIGRQLRRPSISGITTVFSPQRKKTNILVLTSFDGSLL